MNIKKAIQNEIDEAIFNFTVGNNSQAKIQISKILESHPKVANAWHALAEILLSEKEYKEAAEAANKAHDLEPEDLHINTTLSRIWVQMGDKKKAEYYNAKARMMSWKEQLQEPQAKENQ